LSRWQLGKCRDGKPGETNKTYTGTVLNFKDHGYFVFSHVGYHPSCPNDPCTPSVVSILYQLSDIADKYMFWLN